MTFTKAALLFVLLVTIPRWAETLAVVDTFTVRGLPVTAIGEGVVIELAAFLLAITHGRCVKAQAEYAAKREADLEREADGGRRVRRPEQDPAFHGYGSLMTWFYVLVGMTLLAQTPFIYSRLTSRPVAGTLGTVLTWGYAVVLVVSPEVVTVALARVAHFEKVLDGRGRDRSFIEQVLDWFAHREQAAQDVPAPVPEGTEPVPEPLPLGERRAEIVRLWKAGETNKAALGRRFGVSARTITKDLAAAARHNGDFHAPHENS